MTGPDTPRGRRAGPVDLRPGPLANRLGVVAAPVPDAFVDALRRELGPEAVSLSEEECVAASRDWWPLAARWALAGALPAQAAVVARPPDDDGVAAAVRLAVEYRVPLTASAGRSGVCGGAVPVAGGAVLDVTAIAGVTDIDDTSGLVTVGAGTFGDDLEAALGAAGLTLGHWPQSMALSTVGGWVACRSAGQYSTRYGKIEDMTAALAVVDGRGRRLRTGGAPRSATGPDLTALFVGSEGTLGVVTEATLRTWPRPAGTGWAAWFVPTMADGLDVCRRARRRGAAPAVLRLYDRVEAVRAFGEDGPLLLVLDEGDPASVDGTLAVVEEECRRTPGTDARDRRLLGRWLEHRNDVSALGTLVASGRVVDTIELAARWSALAPLYERVTAAIAAVPGTIVASGHCSHCYVDGGCLYFTFVGAGTDTGEAGSGHAGAGVCDGGDSGDRYYRAVLEATMEAALELGATVSHHHGVGLVRAPWLARSLGAEAHSALCDLKAVFDPAGVLNPGKLGLPSPFVPPGWSWC